MERLVDGLGLAEAPCVDADGALYFSDALQGGVYRLRGDGAVETVVPKRRGVGGLALHADGGLVVSGRELLHVRDGEQRLLAQIEGVTGFNDLGVDPEGRVLAGALRFHPFKGEEPVPGEVWRVELDSALVELFDGIEWPNGIGVSADGRTVYTCDYASGRVLAHDLSDAGWSERGRVFARAPGGQADGLALDERGGVWVALGNAGSVVRFEPDGTLDRTLDVPADFVSSLCFGGEDMRDVFLTTSGPGAVFRTRVNVAGLPVPLARV